MQVIRRAIGRQRIGQTVEREPPVRDAIGDTTEHRAEVERRSLVVGETVVAEYDVGEFAIAIGDPQLGECRTVLGDFRDGAGRVDDREDLRRRTFTRATELPLADGRGPRACRRVAACDDERATRNRR